MKRAGIGGDVHHQRDIDLPAGNLTRQPGRSRFRNAQLEVRHILAQAPDQAWADELRKDGWQPKGQGRLDPARVGPHVLERHVDLLQRVFQRFLEIFPLVGKHHALGHTLEQAHAQLVFQQLHLPAQRGLRDTQCARGSPQRALGGDPQEITQPSQFHHLTLCRYSMALSRIL